MIVSGNGRNPTESDLWIGSGSSLGDFSVTHLIEVLL